MKIVKLKNKNNEEVMPNVIDNSLDNNSHRLAPSINLINKLFFYQDGDTYKQTKDIAGGGYISSSTTTVYFSIFLPKRLDKISTITLNNINVTIRSANGYLLEKVTTDSFDGTMTVIKATENSIMFALKQNIAFDAINNTPIGFEINALELTFNK